MVKPCGVTRAKHSGMGRHDMGYRDISFSATWKTTPPKEEDEGETGEVAVGVAFSRRGLIASPVDITTMQARRG